MNIKKKTKQDLCDNFEKTYSIVRRNRDINVLKYDTKGLVDVYSLKIGSCYFVFNWLSDSQGYELNKNLTSMINVLKSKKENPLDNVQFKELLSKEFGCR